MKYATPILTANYLINIASVLWSYIDPIENPDISDIPLIALSIGLFAVQFVSLYAVKNAASGIAAHNSKMLLGDMWFIIRLALGLMAAYTAVLMTAILATPDIGIPARSNFTPAVQVFSQTLFFIQEASLIWLALRSAKGLYLTLKNRPVSHKWV